MTKKDLEEFAMLHAQIGRKQMIDSHGSFRQQAAILDRRGRLHVIMIANTVLHGSKMADLLLVYATSVGGADAILVQSDARVQEFDSKAAEDEVTTAARRGEYRIADNPKNQEVFITGARSREHTALIVQAYQRRPSSDGDVIAFNDPEPRLETRYDKVEIGLIPNIWERVN